jgi:branched-subunit amino acid aminotransferase/4-amino-4-deoxychorismate lyase
MPKAYWNGNYCDESDIRISPRDLGLLRGYAAFDVMPVYRSRPFHADRHYARLARSAETLRLQLPVDAAAFTVIATELSQLAGLTEATIRTVLSGGPSENGFHLEPGRENFFMLVEPVHSPAPSVYRDGVSLMTLEYERSLPQVKFANHAIAIQDLGRRDAAGAYETLYVNGGMVSECSQSNLFWVRDGQLGTTWDNTLRGITQGLVLELAQAIGITTKKSAVSLENLLQADEVFITGSSKAIVPVVGIDGRKIGAGTVGSVTQALMTAYREYRAKY